MEWQVENEIIGKIYLRVFRHCHVSGFPIAFLISVFLFFAPGIPTGEREMEPNRAFTTLFTVRFR